MRASRSEIFALQKSGLGKFLYADVGAEPNGATITILSVLARLDRDPWAEAARWAALPKALAADSLARAIAEMPLLPSALAASRDTALRLVQLLPTDMQEIRQPGALRVTLTTPKWVLITILYVAFIGGMELRVILMSRPSFDIAASGNRALPMPASHDKSAVPPPADGAPGDAQ